MHYCGFALMMGCEMAVWWVFHDINHKKSHPNYTYLDICFTRPVSGHQQVIEYEEGEGATNRIVDDDDVRDGAIEV